MYGTNLSVTIMASEDEAFLILDVGGNVIIDDIEVVIGVQVTSLKVQRFPHINRPTRVSIGTYW